MEEKLLCFPFIICFILILYIDFRVALFMSFKVALGQLILNNRILFSNIIAGANNFFFNDRQLHNDSKSLTSIAERWDYEFLNQYSQTVINKVLVVLIL